MAFIDLSRLPPPDLLETLDYEAILAALAADYQARLPDTAEAPLESDPAYKVLEAAAYRETLLRARGNRLARAVLLATATGTDLTNLAALYGVARQVVTPADPTAIPPVAAVLESDERLRRRTQLAPDGFSVAGPRDAYVFHALSASSQVLDAAFLSPSPSVANVYVISRETGRNGVPTGALLQTVRTALSADDVRPAGDQLTVAAATFVDYQIQVTLQIESGPDPQIVRDAAMEKLREFTADNFRIGRDIHLSSIYAAATVPNVIAVTLATPAATVVTTATETPRVTQIQVT